MTCDVPLLYCRGRLPRFVFRQITQEHRVIVHLTDATLGYYALDILLDANGNPQTNTDARLTAAITRLVANAPAITARREVYKLRPPHIGLAGSLK